MPLLSNKLYILNKIRKDKKDEDSTICHSLTNEICENEEELNRKTFLYNQKIWTCRITGQINLTFKEALKSEQGCSKMLKNSFKKCFEASVLQFVHHSKESLDTLIHKAWTQIHQEYCVNEPVTIKLTAPKEMILKGVVVKVDRSRSNDDQENSPIKLSSDASSSDKENMKKKIIPVKKNYFYSVKIFEMDKLVKDIPSETIERTLRPPSKDQIRMFIRAHAIRHSGKQNNPWVVDEELVKKYRLPNLEPEFAVDKQKMKELSRTTEIQMFNKMKDEHRDATVDLTRSDDEENNLSMKRKSLVNETKEKLVKNKILKQTTLFDGPMTTTTTSNASQRNSNSSNAIRSPLSSPTRSLPPLAQRLLKLMKDNPSDPNVKQLIFKCGQLFSNQQIAKFPDLIRVPITDRKEKYEEKKRLDAMTADQREAYLNERRNQMRRQLREKKREENTKLEDNELEYAKQIPEGTPISIEGGMNQDQWARLVSVCEFVRCYKRLLMPSSDASDDSKVLTARDLCQSVISKCDNSHEMLAEFVCVLLKPLLQDSRIRSRKEMGLALTELPVTVCTAGELLRLVLLLGIDKRETRQVVENDGNEETNDDIKDQHGDVADEEVSTEIWNCNHNKRIAGPICEKLQTVELQQLSIEDKIGVLELLQNRILELDIVSSFIDDYQREVCEAYKKRITDTKEVNDKLKAVRQSKQEMCKLIGAKFGTDDVTNKSMTGDGNNSGRLFVSGGTDSLITDDTSQVVRRRLSIEMKIKESEERERRLEKERQYQKLEKEEIQLKKLLDQSQKSYFTATNEAKQLMRIQPLGSDRHFRRYWHFISAPGAIYVEIEQTSTGTGTIGNNTTSPDHILTEWNMFTTHDELKQLLNCLSDKGIRESLLKSELESLLPKLTDEFQLVSKENEEQAVRTNPPVVADSGEQSFLVTGFKRELKETEISIRQGSLGGVEDYVEWQKRVNSSVTLNEMKETLVSVFLGVHERFWNVPLKSANGRNEFLNAVEQAQTQARLNMLQSFLDACVCWSKSAKDDKCRVCRKASDENSMLLCDSCNHAFHTFCLRPALHDIPEGEWFCPHCKPVSRARDADSDTVAMTFVPPAHSVTQSIKSKTRQNSHQEQCFVCHSSNGEQQLAKCTSCNKLFHAHCHEPPLRQIRRTNWHCCQCRLDEATKTNKQPSRRSISTVGAADVNDNSDGNDDDQNSSSNEDPDQNSRKRNRTKKRNKARNGLVKKKPFSEVEKDDEDDVEDRSEGESQKSSVKPPLRKKSRITKSNQAAEESKPSVKSLKLESINNSDSDESDQDVDNLPYLFAKRSANRKRSSVTGAGNVKYHGEDGDSNGDDNDNNKAPAPKKLCNGMSVEKTEPDLSSSKRSTSRKRGSVTGTGNVKQERQSCNGSGDSDDVVNKAPIQKKSCNGISAEKIEKACYHMLKNMMSHKASWPFIDPVDPEEVPDYYQIITDPINIAQMMEKYKQGIYASGIDSLKIFLSDVGQMFFNAEVYNMPDSDIMNLAITLEQFFKGIYSKYEFGVEYTRMTDTTN